MSEVLSEPFPIPIGKKAHGAVQRQGKSLIERLLLTFR